MTFLPQDVDDFFTNTPAAPKQTEFKVASESSAGKVYTVDISGVPTCDCVAYKVNRNKKVKALGLTGQHADVFGTCKHVDYVLDRYGK